MAGAKNQKSDKAGFLEMVNGKFLSTLPEIIKLIDQLPGEYYRGTVKG